MSSKTVKSPSITPLSDRVLLRRLEAEERTRGGIVLPDTAKEKPREGVVIAVGRGRLLDNGERVPFTVRPKDRVLFSSYAGTEVKIEGEEYLIVGEDEILAVLD